MTNTMRGSISRFWLEVNATAWRYCPETVQHRLNAAYITFTKEMRELLREQSDSDFGRGWREGHEVGRLDGWAQRDVEAQRELARKNDQIQALMMLVERYRTGIPGEEPAAGFGDNLEGQPLGTIGLSCSPRPPVH